MGRRHSASRRRSYGRRQHEVRERLSGTHDGPDWDGGSHRDDWRLVDPDDDAPRQGHGESFGRSQP